MRKRLLFLLQILPICAVGQVFQQVVAPAPQAVGAAILALEKTNLGFANEAVLALAENSTNLLAGASLPYSIGGWQTTHVFAAAKWNNAGGFGFVYDHSKIENYSEQRWRVGFGRQLAKNMALGVSLDYLRVWAAEYGVTQSASAAVAFWAKPFEELAIGVRLQNPFFVKMNEHYLPVLLQMGIAWKVSPIFDLFVEVEKDIVRMVEIKAGWQYQMRPKVLLRAGCRTAPARPAWGAGFFLQKNLRLDFSSEWHPNLGITPSAGICWSPDKKGRKTGQ